MFQVVVSNAKDVKDFDFPATNAFVVQPLGPSNNNSTQISIVNGKYSKIEKRETLYNFRLVAKQEGNLVIPPIGKHQKLLESFLTHCDLVRFAKHTPEKQEIQATFDACKQFIIENQ